MSAEREILWNVPPGVMNGVYLLSALSAAWIVVWFARRARLWSRGGPSPDQLSWRTGIWRLVRYLLTHRALAYDPYARCMHRLIFWGFLALLLATTLVAIQHYSHIVFLTGTTYLAFSLGADLGGLAFSIGIALALWRRRTLAAHGRLLPRRSTTLVLWLLLLIAVSGFLLEGLRIARDFPPFEKWSPIGYALACLLAYSGASGEPVLLWHLIFWIFHAALVLVFFVLIPVTVLNHLFLGAYSVMRPAGRPGLLHAPAVPVTGAAAFAHFRRLDLLQADACLTCGMCTTVCPAQAAGKPLSPRSIVLGLRDGLDHPQKALSTQIEDAALWSCTTCNACDHVCPINIHIVDKIVTLRRGRVAASAVPTAAADALEASAQKFNPFNRPNSTRTEWTSGLNVPVAKAEEPVELLYWVGCAGAFDPAGREVARAMVTILNRTEVPYRILGCRERCTGDPARRLGEEGLWEELAGTNQQLLAAHRVQTILTSCPHCFNTFKNEYPRFGPMPQVVHHTQWLRDKLQEGSLKVNQTTAETLTFHDPCYLGRANDETAAPRQVLDTIAGPRREMQAHGKESFCCGGGGGQLWLEVRGRTRVETIRANHVESTGAATVATACPFCRVMLEAGRMGLPPDQGKWRVKDLAELVAENLVS